MNLEPVIVVEVSIANEGDSDFEALLFGLHILDDLL